jgi:hypothetical protein
LVIADAIDEAAHSIGTGEGLQIDRAAILHVDGLRLG